ncbi:MAG: hypothetical protein RLZZ186_1538 [Cyanobacteriota bacterium]
MGNYCRDQAERFEVLNAATYGCGDALMAIGLDANCFAEAQGLRDRHESLKDLTALAVHTELRLWDKP